MTFVQAALFFPGVVGAISVVWLMVYLPRTISQDRKAEAGGMDDLDELRWTGWSLARGWAPATCWHGCAELHRDDWWRVYTGKKCWRGCVELHRDDWWKAYLDQAD